MKSEAERPPQDSAAKSRDGGLDVSETEAPNVSESEAPRLSSLPVGARLILRCRKDWRDATVVAVSFEAVTLSVMSPTGRTYRLRRPPDAVLCFDGAIPILGEGHWRAGRARYDTRW